MVRLVGGELGVVVELAVDDDVDLVAERVRFAVARDLEPTRVGDGGENREAIDDPVDFGLVLGGE